MRAGQLPGLALAALALLACTPKASGGAKVAVPIVLKTKPSAGLSPEGAGGALVVGPNASPLTPPLVGLGMGPSGLALAQPTATTDARGGVALTLEGLVLAPAGIISNHGGGVLSNHGAQWRALAQATGEAPLGDTWVGVQDEQGQALPGLSARTGPDGRFRLSAPGLSPQRSYLVAALGSQGGLTVSLRALGRPGRPVQLRWASELATLAVAERVASPASWAAVPPERFEALVQGIQEALERQAPPVSPASAWPDWVQSALQGQGDWEAKLQRLTDELQADTDRELAKAKAKVDVALDQAASEVAEAQRKAEADLKKALGDLKLP